MTSQERAQKLEELRKRMTRLAEPAEAKMRTTEMAKPAITLPEPEPMPMAESDAEFEEVEDIEVPYAEAPQYPPLPVVGQPQRRMAPQPMPQFQPQMPVQQQVPVQEQYYPSQQIQQPMPRQMVYMQDAEAQRKQQEAQQKEEQVRQMQMEIERLQNAGTFRAELLYQLVIINAHLGRIATQLQ